MNQIDLLFGMFLIIVILLFFFRIDYMIKKESQCIEGKTHNWVLTLHSKGNTGDLGFGIKGYWNKNHYRCSICKKEKSEDL